MVKSEEEGSTVFAAPGAHRTIIVCSYYSAMVVHGSYMAATW